MSIELPESETGEAKRFLVVGFAQCDDLNPFRTAVYLFI